MSSGRIRRNAVAAVFPHQLMVTGTYVRLTSAAVSRCFRHDSVVTAGPSRRRTLTEERRRLLATKLPNLKKRRSRKAVRSVSEWGQCHASASDVPPPPPHTPFPLPFSLALCPPTQCSEPAHQQVSRLLLWGAVCGGCSLLRLLHFSAG